MFSLSSLGIPRFGFGRTSKAGKIDLVPVKVYNIETEVDKRGRSLKHLIKLNHANFSILYNDLKFHNHTPHILGSAYLLGATADHLNEIYDYDAQNEGHEPWKDSPSEIALHDYRDFLGLKEYQRAWVDFFEDQLIHLDYDWKQVATKFLFESGPSKRPNPIPMIHCIVSGLGHPLIHLGYAYELNSREIAMEALGLAATCYDPKFASLVDENISKFQTNTANLMTYSTSNPFEVLARINGDSRFDGVFKGPGYDNILHLFSDQHLTSILLDHWSAWKIPSNDPRSSFEQSQKLATALLISTSSVDGGHGYDFFLVHLLTTSHALRIIYPFLDAEHHIPLLKQWWLLLCAVYIAQMRPVVSVKQINDYDLRGGSWESAEDLSLIGKHKFDAHYVKAIRAIKENAQVWGDDDEFYLKAAVKFATEFDGWKGFDSSDAEEESKEARGKMY